MTLQLFIAYCRDSAELDIYRRWKLCFEPISGVINRPKYFDRTMSEDFPFGLELILVFLSFIVPLMFRQKNKPNLTCLCV